MHATLNTKRLSAASVGHFAIDILNSSIAMILTAVSGVFELTVGQIGMAAMIYTFSASLTQPLFGALNDRWRGRWLAGAGTAWTMVFYGLAPFMPNYPALVTCLAIAALGSGAFHPAGMVNATVSGGRYPTTATSIFFVAGQSGLALGPILTGIIIQNYGLAGLPFMALAMLPAVVFMFATMNRPYADDHEHTPPPTRATTAATSEVAGPTPSNNSRVTTRGVYVLIAFVLLITLRSTTQQGFVTLLPKYFSDMGYAPATYGAMLSILGLAGAVGTFLGGYLGDRFNRRMIIFGSMTLGALFSLLLLRADGWMYAAAALGAGVMMNIPHSILLIMAQRLLPKRKGMVGGAVLGLMFASGAAMTGIGSRVADFVGLPTVLVAIALMPIGAGLCALLLPATRGVEPATVPPKPAASAAD